MVVIIIKTKAEFDEYIAGSLPVIVDFTASWCPPCRMLGPKFEEFSEIYGQIKFIKVDVDEVSEVAAACEISAMPTFKVFKDGQCQNADTVTGANEAALRALCEKYS